MPYIVAGLGNPGEEYASTRHNAGRIAAEIFVKKKGEGDFSFDKKINAHKATFSIGREKVIILLPDTYMNKSGNSVKHLVSSAKKARTLIVIHDDLDIPFGSWKISFGKNSGGNKGVESIIRALKTKNFIRVRIGIAPSDKSGKIKKTRWKSNVEKLILGDFTPEEMRTLKRVSCDIAGKVENIIMYGYERAISINT